MFSREEKILIFLLGMAQFTHTVDFMIVMPLGPTLMSVLKIDPHQFGLIVSSYTLCAGASGFLASLFVDRFDRKKNLLFFFFGFTIGTILCGLAPNYPTLLFFRSITGVFGGVLSSLSLAIITDRIDYSRRGTALGFLATSFSVASIVGVPFSLYLANHFGWQSPFYFLGLVAVLCCITIHYQVPSMREHLGQKFEGSFIEPLRRIATSPSQLKAMIFMFFLMFGHFTIIPFISPSFVANAGIRNEDLAFVYLVGGACSMLFSPILGRASDRYGKHQIFTLSVLLSLLPIYLITHLGPNSLPTVLTISAFFFILAGGRMIPAQAMISALASPEQRGSYMSVVSCVQQLSMAIGSYIAGVIVYTNDTGKLINYPIVGYLAIVSSLLAMAIAWKINTTAANTPAS